MSAFQPNLLAGKTAFLTGAGSGINRAIAKRFVEQGANVVLVGRTQEKLDAAAAEMNLLGKGKAVGIAADVRLYDQLEVAAERGSELFGSYDIVVAGAAGNFVAPVQKLSANGFATVVDIDLKGTFHTFRVMSERLNKGASLIAISAPQATQVMYGQAHACAAKAGIEMLVKSLAVEWGPRGIRVNGLTPGFVENTLGGDLFKGGDGGEAVKKRLPIQRFATVDEMADMALMMCTPVAAYMTGHIIVLDGGVLLLGAGSLAG
ncbi:MAG TPA: SDR family oxidoreductase [Pseudomonadales bacterium]|nr:SDR family oxidoreductase [Pseudomonadales bacterium]